MIRASDILMGFRCMIKMHESFLKEICERYHLTLIEGSILMFLHNNPGKDTAADIVELRMLSKGNVSQAVEALIKRNLLERHPDLHDRRKIHLSLLPETEEIIADMDQMRQRFHQELFWNLSEEEQEQFASFNGRIFENAKRAMKRREES